MDDQVWVLRQEGAGCVGYDRDPGATILSIGLEPPGDREDASATRYLLARNLADVAEEELVSLVREVARAPDPDSDPPRGTSRHRSGKPPPRRHVRRRGPRR